MLYIIFCEDKPNSLDLRMQARPIHLEYIKPLADSGALFCAGPTPSVDSMSAEKPDMTGSLIIAEFDSYHDAKQWADNDPYYLAGLFEKVTIKPYVKVLP